jgi:ABC-type bacteriocin/lantibiotic exporter with double-glycine peptidase domain
MKHLIAFATIACIALAGLIPESVQKTVGFLIRERPTINLPMKSRQRNWVDSQNSGSCVFASMIMLFRWQGRPDLAARWRQIYAGGERWTGLEAKLRDNKVPYASTHGQNDVSFLEWAIRTRRGCIVTVMEGKHMVVLVELTDTQAGILDNNSPEKVQWMPRDQFLKIWFAARSWSCTPMFTPPPPHLREK